MKKEKVKNFIKENKTAIIVGAATAIGCLIGYKYCEHEIIKKDPRLLCDSLKVILDDAESVYEKTKNRALYTQILDPVNPKELGKLGEQIIEDAKKHPGKEFKLTHFVAIGEYYEN